MPFCSLVQQTEQHSVEWFGEETFEHRDRTLVEPKLVSVHGAVCLWVVCTHLENIFKITGGKLFHL